MLGQFVFVQVACCVLSMLLVNVRSLPRRFFAGVRSCIQWLQYVIGWLGCGYGQAHCFACFPRACWNRQFSGAFQTDYTQVWREKKQDSVIRLKGAWTSVWPPDTNWTLTVQHATWWCKTTPLHLPLHKRRAGKLLRLGQWCLLGPLQHHRPATKTGTVWAKELKTDSKYQYHRPCGFYDQWCQ